MPRLRCQRSKAPVRPLSGKNEPEGNLLVDRGVLIGPLEVTLRKSPARCGAFLFQTAIVVPFRTRRISALRLIA